VSQASTATDKTTNPLLLTFLNQKYTKSGTNPIDQNKYSLLQQNGNNGTLENSFNLGEQTRDQDKGDTCMRMGGNLGNNPNSPVANSTRRIGICSDGLYTIKTRHTDSAGNLGDWVSRVLERDSVRPADPTTNISLQGSIGNQKLGVNILGEADTAVNIKLFGSNGRQQTFFKTLDNNGNFNTNNLTSLTCGGISYYITISLTDRAGNISQTITSNTIKTDVCPFCSSSGSGMMILPIPAGTKYTITGEFPKYDGDTGRKHSGLDIAAASGTPILAAMDGIVERVTYGFTDNYGKPDPFAVKTGFANNIVIRHLDPIFLQQFENEVYTIYAHLAPETAPLVKVGDFVSAGTQIARLGSTGSSSGFHLHFQTESTGAPFISEFVGNSVRANPFNPRSVLPEIKGNSTSTWEALNCDFANQGDYDATIIGTDNLELILDPNYLNIPVLKQDLIGILAADREMFSNPIDGQRWLERFADGFIDGAQTATQRNSESLQLLLKKIDEIRQKSFIENLVDLVEAILDLIDYIKQIIQNPEPFLNAIGQWISNIVNSLSEEGSGYSEGLERAYKFGQMAGELAVNFFVVAITNSAVKTFSELLRAVFQFTSVVTFQTNRLINTKAILGPAKRKTTLKEVTFYNNQGGINRRSIGVTAKDALDITENADDLNYGAFRSRLTDTDRAQKLDNHRNSLKACGLIGGLVTASATPNTNFNFVTALFGSVKVEAQSGGCNSIIKLFNSVQSVFPNYKKFKSVEVEIKNQTLLDSLQEYSSGNWVKIYEAGEKSNNKVEIHYFLNKNNGRVFDVKVKYDYWHQPEFKN
jgi:murein DD-endopeptidase MepM/ murein hydrolase activator NlpD